MQFAAFSASVLPGDLLLGVLGHAQLHSGGLDSRCLLDRCFHFHVVRFPWDDDCHLLQRTYHLGLCEEGLH